MSGAIVTFYSYKGGVGRSFALCNVAIILAQWGTRVLMVDWDIEAPGLNHYFCTHAPRMSSGGVLNFLDDCVKGTAQSWTAYAAPIALPDGVQDLYLMPAAAGGGMDYADQVQRLNWDALYEEHEFGAQLEALRAEWLQEFDLVLVDSRTGLNDFSGVTTAQLPDVLAFLFTANAQSLQGCADIVRRAMEARRRMPVDRPALLPLPIPARFEQREEYERAQAWRARFGAELTPFLDVWKPRGADVLKLIDLLTVPYVPRWTFGEELAALLEPAGTGGTRTPGQAVSYALETLAALLVHGFAKVDLLVSSRDEYVHAARAVVQGWRAAARIRAKVFVSYTRADRTVVDEIVAALRNAELMLWTDTELAHGEVFEDEIRREVEDSDAYLVVIGPFFSRLQEREVELFLRHSLRAEQRKPIIPVVLPGGEKALALSRLGDFAAVYISPDEGPVAEQFAPVISRLEALRG
jgi:MinD-like ATPase involved in chromosome partitioning or flagellar assembly/nucleotide-binding universal stress UspA family protein